MRAIACLAEADRFYPTKGSIILGRGARKQASRQKRTVRATVAEALSLRLSWRWRYHGQERKEFRQRMSNGQLLLRGGALDAAERERAGVCSAV